MKINTLRFKLTIWYLILLGLIVIAAGVFLFQVVKEKRLAEFDRDLRNEARELTNRWERTRGLTWEQAIARTQEGSRRPYIRLVKLTFRDPRKKAPPAADIRSANVPENAFPFEKEAYDRAFRARGGEIPVFLTVRDRLLSEVLSGSS